MSRVSAANCESSRSSAERRPASDVVLAIHGGAGVVSRELMAPGAEKEYRAKLREAVEAGRAVIEKGDGDSDHPVGKRFQPARLRVHIPNVHRPLASPRRVPRPGGRCKTTLTAACAVRFSGSSTQLAGSAINNPMKQTGASAPVSVPP